MNKSIGWALCFCAFFALGFISFRWIRTKEISPRQAYAASNPAPKPTTDHDSKNAKHLSLFGSKKAKAPNVLTGSGEEFFSWAFGEKFQTQDEWLAHKDEIMDRLQSPLPRSPSREVVARLGLIKALAKSSMSASGKRAFHDLILAIFQSKQNRNWLIEREALYSLGELGINLTENEREETFGAAHPIARSLAGKSDREILHAVILNGEE